MIDYYINFEYVVFNFKSLFSSLKTSNKIWNKISNPEIDIFKNVVKVQDNIFFGYLGFDTVHFLVNYFSLFKVVIFVFFIHSLLKLIYKVINILL